MPSPTGTDEYPSRDPFTNQDVRKLKSMSVMVAPPKNELESGVYRNALYPQALVKGWPQVRTLYDVLQKGFRTNPNGAMLGRREKTGVDTNGQPTWSDYKWITYAETNELITLFGSGIMDVRREMLHHGPEDKCAIGIYAINRPEWIIAEQATYAYSMYNIALYDTLGPDAAEFIINHGEVQILILSADKISNVLRVRDKCAGLKVLISMDSLDSREGAILREWAKEKNIALLDFNVVVEMGRAKRVPHKPPKPSDWATVMYTSGTTGNPKGVILTHQCFLSTIRGASLASVEITKNDVHISYLPLAHIYEKSVAELMILNGARIGFYRGDVLLLVEDIAALKPTMFASVPRLLNRIYNRILSQTLNGPSAFKAALFRRALDAKLANMRDHHTLDSAFWDRLVFNKLKAVLGGNVRAIISAAAPIAPETLGFFRVAFGAEVTEAYGQTESCGAGTSTLKGDYATGSVGAPSLCVEMKLVSVPDMNYLATDKPNPRGEICFRGPAVCQGYYKDEEKTKETIDEDGWLHTGDIGQIDSNGKLWIMDRKKHIFKLSQGEYVAPEKIEQTYLRNPLLAQCFVHGDSLQNNLVAVVVPDFESVLPLCEKEGICPGKCTPAEVVKDPKLKAIFMKEMEKTAKQYGLKGFENVTDIYLESDLFSTDNGLLTPTLKTKRQSVVEKYRPEIDAMYAKMPKPI